MATPPETRGTVGSSDLPPARPDRLARVLEAGLLLLVLTAPLAYGAVVPGGRGFLEIVAYALGTVWLVRALLRPVATPPLAVSIAVALLLALALLQALPLGTSVSARLSPESARIRHASQPRDAALTAEQRLLGVFPGSLDPPAAVSLAPEDTASALRTGAALALLLLVGASVAGACGVRRLAVALLVSAALQALYGILILASGHDMIWHLPKRYYLDSATGTFVNRNHFAAFLAAALPAGLALVISAPRPTTSRNWRGRILGLFGAESGRAVLWALLVTLALAGLLLSLSRTGIVLGLAGLGLTLACSRRPALRGRVAIALLVLAVAVVPLWQFGAERLTDRYAHSAGDLTAAGGRLTVWSDSLDMWRDHPWLGVGFGTFATSYPLYRSASVRLFYDHAHNDAVQLLAEGGGTAAVLIAIVLFGVLRSLVRALGGSGGPLAVGLAAGLAAMLVHALIDFNFHIPANAALAAILAGALLGGSCNGRS